MNGSPSERLEASGAGRSFISVLVVVLLLAILVSNLPASEIRRRTYPLVRPVLQATGLNQRWHLFAPDTPRTTRILIAKIRYADGSSVSWRTPRRDPVIGVYTAARWRKLTVFAMSDDGADLLPDIAAWLARTHVRGDEPPESVELVKQYYTAPEPGSGARGTPEPREESLYTWRQSG